MPLLPARLLKIQHVTSFFPLHKSFSSAVVSIYDQPKYLWGLSSGYCSPPQAAVEAGLMQGRPLCQPCHAELLRYPVIFCTLESKPHLSLRRAGKGERVRELQPARDWIKEAGTTELLRAVLQAQLNTATWSLLGGSTRRWLRQIISFLKIVWGFVNSQVKIISASYLWRRQERFTSVSSPIRVDNVINSSSSYHV